MRKVDRPLRLYVLTIFVVVAYGVLPFVSTMPFGRGFLMHRGLWVLPFNGSIVFLYGPDGEASLLLVTVSLFLCVFSAASAFLAFYGINTARIATLVLLTLNVLWWTFLIVTAIYEGGLPAELVMRMVIEPIPPLGWLLFIWWNYTRPDVMAYCDQEGNS